jgi:hypothetical protein
MSGMRSAVPVKHASPGAPSRHTGGGRCAEMPLHRSQPVPQFGAAPATWWPNPGRGACRALAGGDGLPRCDQHRTVGENLAPGTAVARGGNRLPVTPARDGRPADTRLLTAHRPER